jgi:4-hydroxybenzoate polyprenyltransferase
MTSDRDGIILAEPEPSAPPPSIRATGNSDRASARDYLALLRPAHWIKNIVVFAGPAAGLKLTSGLALGQAFLAFAVFCLASSGVYALNDAIDHEADARHPTKKVRPVARGVISPVAAVGIAAVLFGVSMAVAFIFIQRGVALVLGAYIVLTIAYTLALKERVILDVIVVALGFVLRAWAGALAVGVVASSWLIACVFTLCLFMGFGKRRCEVALLGNTIEAGRHRGTLVRYTPELLTHLIAVSAGIAVITFLLYTLDAAAHPSPFPKEHLFYTLPIVVYGIFRFAMLAELGIYAGPTEMVFKDKALLAAIILWAGCALVIAYQVPLFGEGGLGRLLALG